MGECTAALPPEDFGSVARRVLVRVAAAYDGVRILDPQGDPIDAAKKFGVPPGRIGDYLALVGDASDNVAGVRGCGPKSAVAFGAQIKFRDALFPTGSTCPELMSHRSR